MVKERKDAMTATLPSTPIPSSRRLTPGTAEFHAEAARQHRRQEILLFFFVGLGCLQWLLGAHPMTLVHHLIAGGALMFVVSILENLFGQQSAPAFFPVNGELITTEDHMTSVSVTSDDDRPWARGLTPQERFSAIPRLVLRAVGLVLLLYLIHVCLWLGPLFEASPLGWSTIVQFTGPIPFFS